MREHLHFSKHFHKGYRIVVGKELKHSTPALILAFISSESSCPEESKGTEVLSILFQLLALGKASVAVVVTKIRSRWAEY